MLPEIDLETTTVEVVKADSIMCSMVDTSIGCLPRDDVKCWSPNMSEPIRTTGDRNEPSILSTCL